MIGILSVNNHLGWLGGRGNEGLADRVTLMADRMPSLADRASFLADRMPSLADRVPFLADKAKVWWKDPRISGIDVRFYQIVPHILLV